MRAIELEGAEQKSPAVLQSSFDYEDAKHFLRGMSIDYPEIETWYQTKVRRGLMLGTRKLIVLRRNCEVAAVGIAKNEDGEKKICTVRVAARYEGLGLGVRVFESCLSWLGDSRPILSVSARNIVKFQKIFDHYGFVYTSSKRGLYIPEIDELFFNEQHILQ